MEDEEDFELLWEEPGQCAEELDLLELEENPTSISSFVSSSPTDANFADRLGLALQRGGCLKELVLDFSAWTKWGALEVMNFLETSNSLEALTLQAPTAQANMTTERTLSSLLEAVASNSTAKRLNKFSLLSVPLQTKNVCPFGQILRQTKTIKILELDLDVVKLSKQDMDTLAVAFGSNNTLEELCIYHLSNEVKSSIFSQLSNTCPVSLKRLRIHSNMQEGHRSDLDVKGMSKFFVSSKCRLQQLQLSHANVDIENSEALVDGVLGNRTLRELIIEDCSFHEPHLVRILREMTHPHHLVLDCTNFQNPSDVIGALQGNISIVHLELNGVLHLCGAAVGQVFAHNRCLQNVHLSWDLVLEDDESEPTREECVENMRLLAEGLRVNTIINNLSIHNFRFPDESVEHLACSLIPPSRQQHQVHYSLIDLALHSQPVSDQCLLFFAKSLRTPQCRLRSLSLHLEDAPSAFYTKGIVKLFEALQVNQSLESLRIGSPASEQSLDPHVLQSLARALGQATKLQHLRLHVGFDSEHTWRSTSRSVVRCVFSSWLAALAGNFSLHSLQFANIMYGHLSVDDKGRTL
jgi:hypothetical protein